MRPLQPARANRFLFRKRPFRHSFQRLLSLPASGYRNYPTGDLTNVGTNGLYWASAPYASGNANAGRLWFNSGNVNPLGSDPRAQGFTVRCVQHLQAAFIKVKG